MHSITITHSYICICISLAQLSRCTLLQSPTLRSSKTFIRERAWSCTRMEPTFQHSIIRTKFMNAFAGDLLSAHVVIFAFVCFFFVYMTMVTRTMIMYACPHQELASRRGSAQEGGENRISGWSPDKHTHCKVRPKRQTQRQRQRQQQKTK